MAATALRSAYQALLKRSRLRPDPHQAALVTRLAQLQSDLVASSTGEVPAPRGLYIHGSVGTGKSRIADLFAATLPTAVSRRRIHFHQFMMDVHARLHAARQSPDYRGDPLISIGRDLAYESRVLCFDEFQVTDIADAMILGRLFGSVWNNGGVMISTSNRHPDGLYENGLNRNVVVPFIRELQSRCEVWEIGGREDYRMKSEGDQVEVFFTDLRRFEKALDRTLGELTTAMTSIPVYGTRSLDVLAAKSEQAQRFTVITGTFQELCEESLGSADYSALCSSTGTIFLRGLRELESHERDFAKRFITLIDLAYESGTRVVCHSFVPMGEVFKNIVKDKAVGRLLRGMNVRGAGGSSSSMMSTFIGETEWSATGLSEASLATGGAGETDVAFAIGRAISRLHEMGSSAYDVRD